jgi:hypothetical protein
MFEEENIASFMVKLDEMKKQSDATSKEIIAW